MSMISSVVGRVVTELEEKNGGFSRCRFGFKCGKEDQYVTLKFWHDRVNMNALQYVKMGKELFVSGVTSVSEYKGKIYVDISVNSFTFLGSPSGNGSKDTQKAKTEIASKTDDDVQGNGGEIPF